MSCRKALMSAALALAATLGTSAAHAGDVRWSVGINLPPMGTVISNQPVYSSYPQYEVYYAPPPVIVHRPPVVVYQPAPVYYVPSRIVYDHPGRRDWRHGHREHQRWDRYEDRRDDRRDGRHEGGWDDRRGGHDHRR